MSNNPDSIDNIEENYSFDVHDDQILKFIDSVFTGKEIRSLIPNYVVRKEQIEIAKRVAGSFINNNNLVVEAPTGIGKTFGYLIPALLSNRKIVIATKTKQLMNQIFNKDVQMLLKLSSLPSRKIGLIKGRKNYFCIDKYERIVKANRVMYTDVIDYIEEHKELQEIPAGVFEMSVIDKITCDTYQCKGSNCTYYDECPFYCAKKDANNSDIIITNYHILLYDIALKGKESCEHQFFSNVEHVIFDEAHSIPDLYPFFIGGEINLYQFIKFFDDQKLIFSAKDNLTIKHTYEELLKIMYDRRKLGKIPYIEIEDVMIKFLEQCNRLIKTTDDTDVVAEYRRLYETVSEFNGYSEGIRYAELQDNIITVKNIPLSVSEQFVSDLHRYCYSSVFISATLTSHFGFDYFLSELGLGSNGSGNAGKANKRQQFNEDGEYIGDDDSEFGALSASTPNYNEVVKKQFRPIFDYQSNAVAYIMPTTDGTGSIEFYADLLTSSGQSMLIICNSLARMQDVYRVLSTNTVLKLENYKVYTQLTFSLDEISQSNTKYVIVGCAMLREGLDFSDTGLRIIVLDKLPFEYHLDLYTKEKMAYLERHSNGDVSTFVSYSLPRALLYFKQAIGRLIRKENDYGGWVINDDRILTKSYGKYFLDALNGAKVTQDLDEFKDFIK